MKHTLRRIAGAGLQCAIHRAHSCGSYRRALPSTFGRYFTAKTSPPEAPSLSTSTRATGWRRGKRVVKTLNPERLTRGDWIDLANTTGPAVTFAGGDKLVQLHHGGFVSDGKYLNTPFPPDARGFLYYHTPPDLPPMAGELRFRMTTSDDPSSFLAGSDMLGVHGNPWNIRIARISATETMTPVRRLLLQEGLIDDHALESVKTIAGAIKRFHNDDGILYALKQPFTVKYESRDIRLVSAGPEHCIKFAIQGIGREMRGGVIRRPYSGMYVSISAGSTMTSCSRSCFCPF